MKQLNICTASAEKNGKGEWGEKPRESVTVKLERDKSEYPKAVRHFCRNRKLRQKAKGVLHLFGFSFVVCSSVSVNRFFHIRRKSS